jgi:hypothetical protein
LRRGLSRARAAGFAALAFNNISGIGRDGTGVFMPEGVLDGF